MLSLDVFMVLKIEFLLNSQGNNFLYPWHCASYFLMLLEVSIQIFVATWQGQNRFDIVLVKGAPCSPLTGALQYCCESLLGPLEMVLCPNLRLQL